MSKLILCLLLLFNIYVCEEESKIRIFDEKKDEKDISVKLGEEFALKFLSNPSTGYSWDFVNKQEVAGYLKLLRTKTERAYTGRMRNHLVGSPVNLYLYFKATNVTNEAVPLQFVYGKHWLKNANYPVTTFKVTVN